MHYIKKFNVEHDNYMICANTDLLAFNQSDIYNGTVTKVSSNVKMDVFMHIANVWNSLIFQCDGHQIWA